MRQFQNTLTLETNGPGLIEFTGNVAKIVADSGIETGLVHVFCRHTSASLLIQENADPDVRRDLEAYFSRLVRDGDSLFVHTAEGDDDMPAHIRTALTAVNLNIPLHNGRLTLGTWQGIYVWEHRRAPHSRRVAMQFIGE